MNRKQFIKLFLLGGLGLALNVKGNGLTSWRSIQKIDTKPWMPFKVKVEKDLGGYIVPQKFVEQLKARSTITGRPCRIEFNGGNGWVDITGKCRHNNVTLGLPVEWVDQDFITGKGSGRPLGYVMPREEDI